MSAPRALGTVVAACLALTWLNPHVYLDTVLLVGSVAAGHGDGRWAFGVGAMVASCVWFTLLATAARVFAPVLARPSAWRVLDTVIAGVMLVLAVQILLPLVPEGPGRRRASPSPPRSARRSPAPWRPGRSRAGVVPMPPSGTRRRTPPPPRTGSEHRRRPRC